MKETEIEAEIAFMEGMKSMISKDKYTPAQALAYSQALNDYIAHLKGLLERLKR